MYLFDNERPYAEAVAEWQRVNNGAWQVTRYVHSLDGTGDLLTILKEGQRYSVHHDGLSSTRLLSDSTATPQTALNYSTFGEPLSTNPANPLMTYQFAGEYYDADTGLIYLRARWMNPTVGRFISMDEFEGAKKLPLSLNKYIYANGDPVNFVDPSGYFSLGGMMAGLDIQSSLGSLQANFGFDLINAALTGEGPSASSIGWGVIASMAPFAIAKTFSSSVKLVSNMGSRGKVAYATGKIPKPHEIATASYVSEKLGVGIYIRGGASTAGADAFISGLRWELKQVSSTPTSIKNALSGSVSQFEKFHSGTPIRVVLDGRQSGLTQDIFEKGVWKVESTQRNRIHEVMVILGDGKIIN